MWAALFRKFWDKGALTGIEFAPHYECNFRCAHCYEKAFRDNGRPILPPKEQAALLGRLVKNGILSITFLGGEATIHPHLDDLIRAAQPEQTYISIASNGWTLNRERIEHYKKLGVDKINLSLDSWVPEEHDAMRNKDGAYAKVLRAVDLCRELGLAASLSMVVQNGSTRTQGFWDIVNYALGKRVRLQLKLAVPVGEWEGRMDKLISRRDRAVVDDLLRKHPMVTACFTRGCRAMRATATVTASGEVMPCNCIHVAMGNLCEEPMETILARGAKVPWFDGQYPGCLVSENKDFITDVLPRIAATSSYPARFAEVFPEFDHTKEARSNS